MKPRSKRNRKRPRCNVNGLKEDPIYETVVRRLELDGKPIPGTHKWLRLINPYPYTYTTFAKARWQGRTIIDVYSSEFGSYPKSYYETAIRQGRILVSDKQVSTSYIIKGGDVLSHTVHRHEPGIAIQSDSKPYISIIGETDELVIVSKPGTIPIHPCGGYNMQCVVNILEQHYKDEISKGTSSINKLYTIHRLDRLTSGLVIFGKTSSVAQFYSKCIKNRSCRKIYLARVAGKFPLQYRNRRGLTSDQVSQLGVPLYGEWKKEKSTSKDVACEENELHVVSCLRKQHALAWWIEDQNGDPVFQDDQGDNESILNRIFQCQHSVEDWIESIDASVRENSEGNNKLWFHLACPTRIAKHKDGVCEASSFIDLDDDLYLKSVKPAHTSFGVISYDDKTDSTLLICRPYTGRTHQIRLHLQHLGHPIANDPNYGGDIWYGNLEGKRACKIAEERLNIINNDGDTQENTEVGDVLYENGKKTKIDAKNAELKSKTSAIDVPATENEIQKGICTAVRDSEESIHAFIERTCVWCARCRSVPTADRAILEFLIRSPGIWLHALEYSFSTKSAAHDDTTRDEKDFIKSFRTDLPEWHDI